MWIYMIHVLCEISWHVSSDMYQIQMFPGGTGKKRERGGKYQIIQYWAVLSRPVYAKPDWGTWNFIRWQITQGWVLDNRPYGNATLWYLNIPSSYGVLVCRKSQKLSPNKTKHLKSVFISICPIYFSYQKRVNKYCCAYW